MQQLLLLLLIRIVGATDLYMVSESRENLRHRLTDGHWSEQTHWVQSKRHRLWFSRKTVSLGTIKASQVVVLNEDSVTGYNQSGTGCGSQRRQCHWVQSKCHRLWFSMKTVSLSTIKVSQVVVLN